MTKSDKPSEFRSIQIDESLRSDHYYLEEDDVCFCLGEYQSGGGFHASDVNRLISNFKKPVDRKNRPEYRYKEQAIDEVSERLRSSLNKDQFPHCTFVPIPPSKCKTDPLYDDRLVRALRSVGPEVDVRELLVSVKSTRAHHEFTVGEKRPKPDELRRNLRIDQECLASPIRSAFVLFDDVLTTGAHFKACQAALNEHFPEHTVIGLFIGRAVRPRQEDDF